MDLEIPLIEAERMETDVGEYEISEYNSKKRKAVEESTETTTDEDTNSPSVKTTTDEDTNSSEEGKTSEEEEDGGEDGNMYEFRSQEEYDKLYNSPADVIVIYDPPKVREYDEVMYPLIILSMMAIRKYNLDKKKSYFFSSVERAFFDKTSDFPFKLTFKAALPDKDAEFFHAWAKEGYYLVVTDVKRCRINSFMLGRPMEEPCQLDDDHQRSSEENNDRGTTKEEVSASETGIKSEDDSESEDDGTYEFPCPDQEGYLESLKIVGYDILYDPPLHTDYNERANPITKLSRKAIKKFNRKMGKSYTFVGVKRAFMKPGGFDCAYDLTFTASLSGEDVEYFHADVIDNIDNIEVVQVNYSKNKSFMEPSKDHDADYPVDPLQGKNDGDTDSSDEEFNFYDGHDYWDKYAEELNLSKFYFLETLSGGVPFRIIYDPPKRVSYNELYDPVTIYSMMAIRKYNGAIRKYNGSKDTEYTFLSLKQAHKRGYIYNLTFEATVPGKDAELFRAWILVEVGSGDAWVNTVKPVRAKTCALSN